MWLSCQRLHVHPSLHVWKWSNSLGPAVHRAQRTSVRKKVENSSWNILTVIAVLGNVALAVAQQSSIAKLASPRLIERWGLSKENITACPARSWKQKAAKKSPDRPARSQANFHTGLFKRPTLLSPAADPLSSDARSPSQLRRMCRVVCEKPGCRRQSSVAVCDAARGVW
jgi:hypothetical protein